MSEFLGMLPPGIVLMIGALFIPFLPKKIQAWVALTLPVLSFGHLLGFYVDGDMVTNSIMGLELNL